MSINDLPTKIKSHFANTKDYIYSKENGLKIKEDLLIVLLLVLVGTASFCQDKLSSLKKKKMPISILKTKDAMLASVALSSDSSIDQTKTEIQGKGIVVASKSGTKYYYPWCSGVSKIKEENKVWFLSIEDAKTAGLTPAANCSGLK